MADRLAPSDRHKYVYGGQTVYEWDQTLTEINMYVQVPPGLRAKDLYCDIQKSHLKLGMHPNPPYMDVSC